MGTDASGPLAVPAWCDPQSRTYRLSRADILVGLLVVDDERFVFVTPSRVVFNALRSESTLKWHRGRAFGMIPRFDLSTRQGSFRLYLSRPSTTAPLFGPSTLPDVGEQLSQAGDTLGTALEGLTLLSGVFQLGSAAGQIMSAWADFREQRQGRAAASALRARTNPLGPGAGHQVAVRSGRLRQLAWASVPVWSFGFLAFAPFLYLAIIRRRIRDWAVFAAYLTVATLFLIYFAGPNGGRRPVAAGGLVVLVMGIAAVHAFIALRPGPAPAPPPEGHALTSPPGPGAGQEVADRSGRLLQLASGWAAEKAPNQQDLAEAADQLAVAIGAQWEAEAAVRGLDDPCQLPVRWVAADACLADDWDVLVSPAGSGAGWASPSPPGSWAKRPDELAGSGNHLARVLAQVPTGRLVVLGEPGAGKTTLMVRLVLDLLASRTSGAPVPVLASLASWNPSERDLHDWLADQLAIDHPALAAAPRDTGRRGRLAALFPAGLILPVLDGLDEIREDVRGQAITQISDSLRPGEQLIMTCRTGPYREAVRPPHDTEITLQAAVIQLCPLDAADVSRYLRDDAGGAGAPARWDPVLATLGTEAPAGRALVTPLMVDLARTIYNPRPGECTAVLGDPAELCRLHGRAVVEAHLLDAFIPATYRSRPASRWDARHAESWLIFLARHLETTIGGPDLAWWQLVKAGPSADLKLAAGLAAGLVATATATLVATLAAGVAGGVAAGLLFGLAGGVGSAVVARKENLQPFQPAGMRALALLEAVAVATLAAGLAIRTAFDHVPGAVSSIVAVGFVYGSAYLAYRRDARRRELADPAGPRAVLARDRRATFDAAIVVGFLFVLLPGSLAGIALWVVVGPLPGFVFGFAFPIFIGIYFSQTQTAWPSYALVRGWLALHRRLPWSLMDFLVDAHQRGILQQVGSVYQFRHIELQRRLAIPPFT
jgi:hypothetical protein